MSHKDTKLVVVKLDDESSPLMKQYIREPAKESTPTHMQTMDPPKEKTHTKTIQFDELSFRIPKPTIKEIPKPTIKEIPRPTIKEIPKPTIKEIPKHESMNISMLATSREYQKRPDTIQKDLKLKLRPIRKKDPIPKKKPTFKNKAEDGYKIGYMPKSSKQTHTLPKRITSISKLQKALSIDVTITGT